MPIPDSARSGVKRRLLREEAYETIRDAILDGTLQLGERLDDKKLQDWLGISRTPIREALNQLAQESLVVIRAQSYTSVTEPDPDLAFDAVQVLGSVFGGVIRVLLPVLDDAGKETLFALFDRGVRAAEARSEREEIATVFGVYDALAELCPNPVLQNVARSTRNTYGFQIRHMRDPIIFDWDIPKSVWPRMRRGLEAGDPVDVQLAFQELHSLPSSMDLSAVRYWRASAGSG